MASVEFKRYIEKLGEKMRREEAKIRPPGVEIWYDIADEADVGVITTNYEGDYSLHHGSDDAAFLILPGKAPKMIIKGHWDETDGKLIPKEITADGRTFRYVVRRYHDHGETDTVHEMNLVSPTFVCHRD